MGENNKGFVTVTDKLTGETKRVTKDEYDISDNLIAGTPGMVAVIDIRDNSSKHVTLDEFNNNDYYQHNTKGMVVALDIRTGTRVHVTKNEFGNSDFLIGVSGVKTSIYNEKSELVHCMPRAQFKKFAKENNYPFSAFEKSEANGGEPSLSIFF